MFDKAVYSLSCGPAASDLWQTFFGSLAFWTKFLLKKSDGLMFFSQFGITDPLQKV